MKQQFTLEKSMGYIINKTAMKLKSELLKNFRSKGFNITTEQWAVLMCLKERDKKTQSEIAEKLIKDKTNLSRILDGMEKREWIVRHTHEKDRRSYRILITKKGKALVEKLIPIVRETNKISTAGLTTKDIRKLERIMTAIYNNLG